MTRLFGRYTSQDETAELALTEANKANTLYLQKLNGLTFTGGGGCAELYFRWLL